MLQRLASICGGERADEGVEGFQISENRVALLRGGVGRAHFYVEIEVQLSPARPLRASFGTVSRRDPEASDEGTFDFTDFRGSQTSTRMLCVSDADASACDDASPPGTCRATRPLIPLVRAMAPEFIAGAWRTAALAGCALHVSSDGSHGTFLVGTPSAEEDAHFAVVQSDDAVFVDLRDDYFAEVGSPLEGDTFTITWVPSRLDHVDVCFPGATTSARTVIGLPEGRVLEGRDVSFEIVRVDANGFRLRLPKGAGEDVMLAYADRDHGDAVERIIATGPVGDGAASLPQYPFSVSADIATCVLDRGALTVRPAVQTTDEFLIPAEF